MKKLILILIVLISITEINAQRKHSKTNPTLFGKFGFGFTSLSISEAVNTDIYKSMRGLKLATGISFEKKQLMICFEYFAKGKKANNFIERGGVTDLNLIYEHDIISPSKGFGLYVAGGIGCRTFKAFSVDRNIEPYYIKDYDTSVISCIIGTGANILISEENLLNLEFHYKISQNKGINMNGLTIGVSFICFLSD